VSAPQEAIAPENVPAEWVEAANRHYSMHGAGLIRNIIAGVAPLIEAAERQRIYDQLGNDHFVIFTPDGWTTEHSVECRLSGHMHECELHTAVGRVVGYGAPMSGHWRIDGIDSEGLPELSRADQTGDAS
jgi:hypothetical protein